MQDNLRSISTSLLIATFITCTIPIDSYSASGSKSGQANAISPAKNTATTQALLKSAEGAYRKDDYKTVIELCNKLLSASPKSAQALYLRALAKNMLDDNSGAIADLKQAISLAPDRLDMQVQLADCLKEQGDVAAALLVTNTAITKMKSQIDKKVEQAVSELAMESPGQRRSTGTFSAAVRSDLEKDLASAYHTRADIQNELCDYAAAIADYTEAIKIDSRSMGAERTWFIDRANAYINNGKIDQALADYQRLKSYSLPVDFGVPDRVLLALRLGKKQDAEADFEKSKSGKPDDDFNAKYGRASIATSTGHPREAIAGWESLLKQKPEDACLHNDIALNYVEIGKWQDAMDEMHKSLKLKPQHDDHILHAMEFSDEMKSKPEATDYANQLLERIEKKLKYNPKNLELLEQKIKSLLVKDDVQKAREVATAFDTDGKKDQALQTLAELAWKEGNKDIALEYYNREVPTNCDASLRYKRAKLLTEMGRQDEAKLDFEAAEKAGYRAP